MPLTLFQQPEQLRKARNKEGERKEGTQISPVLLLPAANVADLQPLPFLVENAFQRVLRAANVKSWKCTALHYGKAIPHREELPRIDRKNGGCNDTNWDEISELALS